MTNLNHIFDQIKALSPESIKQLTQYMAYLQWQESQAVAPILAVNWSFDFIEHFAEASKSPKDNQRGAEIKLGSAVCNGVERTAIYAHPPLKGKSMVEYYVPIPQDIESLTLNLAIGIRDGSQLTDHDLVAFSVYLNDYHIWGTQTNLRRWQPQQIEVIVPPGDMCKLTFSTEALGQHQWTWAVWGEPVLVGKR